MRELTSGVLHTKFWVVDKTHIYIGSANMDWRALTQVINYIFVILFMWMEISSRDFRGDNDLLSIGYLNRSMFLLLLKGKCQTCTRLAERIVSIYGNTVTVINISNVAFLIGYSEAGSCCWAVTAMSTNTTYVSTNNRHLLMKCRIVFLNFRNYQLNVIQN